jgi:hypothetical protein
MAIGCWITVGTNTERICNTLAFPRQNYYANTPPCYVTRTLPVLFQFISVRLVQCGTPNHYIRLHVPDLYVQMSTFPPTFPQENVRDYQQESPVIKSVYQVLPVSLQVLCNIRANKQPSYFVSVTEQNLSRTTKLAPSIQQALHYI